MTQFEAFILIGGRSSRLGRNKALVELGGATLAARAAEVVRRGSCPQRITMVAGSSLQFAIDSIVSDVPFIFDLYEGRGPLGGLQAALAYARTPWIFVIACDYPFVGPELIGLLAGKISKDAGVVMPEQKDGGLQPLCAFYKVETASPIVEEVLERPRVTPPLQQVAALMNPSIVRFEDYAHLPGADEFFINVNTPGDLELAIEKAGKLQASE